MKHEDLIHLPDHQIRQRLLKIVPWIANEFGGGERLVSIGEIEIKHLHLHPGVNDLVKYARGALRKRFRQC